MTTTKLYRVTTIANELRGRTAVAVEWFYSGERPAKRPYAALIENYNPMDEHVDYAESHVEQLFTEDEARQLKDVP